MKEQLPVASSQLPVDGFSLRWFYWQLAAGN